jgi:glycosyltransferase involved in cell wall biosynthesis
MPLVIYNAAILRGRWSGVEWAVWQRAVELASGKSPDEFVFLVAKGVTLPSPLPGGRIVRLPRFVGTRLGRIFHELFLMPRLVRSTVQPFNRSTVPHQPDRDQGSGVRGQGKSLISHLSSLIGYLLSPISYLLSPICDVGWREENSDTVFFAPAYVAPPRLPCPFTLCLYDLHVFTHPQFCTFANRLHYRWRIPSSIRRAKTIEVPSEHVRDVLLERFPNAAEKTVVRHLALRDRYRHPVSDTEKAAVREKFGLPARYILFVGAPSPRKNLPAALAAWQALQADGYDIGFVIAGSQDGRTVFGQPSNRRGRSLMPPPVALGYVPDADMPALYAGASVLLYPSFDEGYGLPIVEAKACGCPVVTSSPTAPEIAPDAFLCSTDEASITAALRAAFHANQKALF